MNDQTATPGRQLHLNLNILNAGFFGSAWRTPGADPQAFADVNHYIRCARVAERGKLDAVFLADSPSLPENPPFRPFPSLDPLLVLSAIARQTSHIGVIATASTSYNEPYNLARSFATLAHVSRGRAGWNMVTTSDHLASANFGQAATPAHAERYERAAEFADVTKRLWDSFDGGTILGDKDSGIYLDTARIRRVGHRGRHFTVQGPLNIPRPPQGRPVLIQAGGSEDGRNLAAAHADAVFTVARSFNEAAEYRRDLDRRLREYGRDPASLLVLSGLVTVIGSTEAEARQRQEELADLLPIQGGLKRLAGTLGVDPGLLDPDKELPEDLPLTADGNQTMARATIALARSERLTVRRLVQKLGGGGGHRIVVGTPEQIAEGIAEWFIGGVADGFNLMPDVLPEGAEVFVDTVVPILQRRGLFRRDYVGATLRDHLGLTG